jgi:hypothetical protein
MSDNGISFGNKHDISPEMGIEEDSNKYRAPIKANLKPKIRIPENDKPKQGDKMVQGPRGAWSPFGEVGPEEVSQRFDIWDQQVQSYSNRKFSKKIVRTYRDK